MLVSSGHRFGYLVPIRSVIFPDSSPCWRGLGARPTPPLGAQRTSFLRWPLQHTCLLRQTSVRDNAGLEEDLAAALDHPVRPEPVEGRTSSRKFGLEEERRFGIATIRAEKESQLSYEGY